MFRTVHIAHKVYDADQTEKLFSLGEFLDGLEVVGVHLDKVYAVAHETAVVVKPAEGLEVHVHLKCVRKSPDTL